MELHYDITKQDFIDFNLNYYNNNAIVQRSIRTMRIATAAIVILGGSALMYWLHTLTPVSIAVYVALAAVCFWGTPRYMRHKMIKNIEKILKNAKNFENAKAFVDFMLSEDAQRFLAENTTSRNVREVEYKNDVMTPLADIKLIYEDSDYVIAHTSELKEKVQDIMMDM